MSWSKPLFLALALSTPALAESAPPSQVAVRFGALHWIDAQGGAPRIRDGRVLVPLKPACNLLRLTCQPQGPNARVNGRLISARNSFVELRALLEGQRAFTLKYDPVAHTAVVGTLPNVDMIAVPWMQAQNDWTLHLRSPYRGPLWVRKIKGTGNIRYTLSTTGTRLNGVTLLSGFPPGVVSNTQVLEVTGAQRPSLPDTPNRDPGCGGKTKCIGTVGREALWVLAVIEAK